MLALVLALSVALSRSVLAQALALSLALSGPVVSQVLTLSLALPRPVMSFLLFLSRLLFASYLNFSKVLLYWLNSQNPKYSRTQNNSLLIAALVANNPDQSSSVMEIFSADRFYAGG